MYKYVVCFHLLKYIYYSLRKYYMVNMVIDVFIHKIRDKARNQHLPFSVEQTCQSKVRKWLEWLGRVEMRSRKSKVFPSPRIVMRLGCDSTKCRWLQLLWNNKKDIYRNIINTYLIFDNVDIIEFGFPTLFQFVIWLHTWFVW